MRRLSYGVAGGCNNPLKSKRSSSYGITRSRDGSAEEQKRTGTLRSFVVLWDERKQDVTAIKRERQQRQVLRLVVGFIQRKLQEQQVACNDVVCGARRRDRGCRSQSAAV